MEFIEKLYAIINLIICGPISYWWWNFSKKSIFIVEHKRALHRKATLDRNQTQSTHVEVIGVENPRTTLFHRFDDKATNPHSLSRMAMFNLASTKATAKKDSPSNNCHYLQVPIAS